MNSHVIFLIITCGSLFLLLSVYILTPIPKNIIVLNIQQPIEQSNRAASIGKTLEFTSKSEYDNKTRIPSKNVIVFLVPSPTGIRRSAYDPYPRLIDIMRILDKHFDDQLKTDVIIFHTGYPFRRDMVGIFHATQRQVYFINIDPLFYRFSPGIDPHVVDPNWTRGGKWNYQQMSYFWFKQVFELKIIQRYKYMMRFDDDSRMKDLWSDVFELLDGHQAVYLANDRDIDLEYVLPGSQKIRNFTVDFLKSHNLKASNPVMFSDLFKKIYEFPVFLTHFEVVDVSFMQRAEVKAFIDAVDQSKGIFLYRWSDALLRYIQMAIFAKPKEVVYRKTFRLSYCHPC